MKTKKGMEGRGWEMKIGNKLFSQRVQTFARAKEFEFPFRLTIYPSPSRTMLTVLSDKCQGCYLPIPPKSQCITIYNSVLYFVFIKYTVYLRIPFS